MKPFPHAEKSEGFLMLATIYVEEKLANLGKYRPCTEDHDYM